MKAFANYFPNDFLLSEPVGLMSHNSIPTLNIMQFYMCECVLTNNIFQLGYNSFLALRYIFMRFFQISICFLVTDTNHGQCQWFVKNLHLKLWESKPHFLLLKGVRTISRIIISSKFLWLLSQRLCKLTFFFCFTTLYTIFETLACPYIWLLTNFMQTPSTLKQLDDLRRYSSPIV